jgi:hypothetical protein
MRRILPVMVSESRATSAGSVVISRRMKSAETFSTVCCSSSIFRCSGVDLPVSISMLDLTLAMQNSPMPAIAAMPMMVKATLLRSLLFTVMVLLLNPVRAAARPPPTVNS